MKTKYLLLTASLAALGTVGFELWQVKQLQRPLPPVKSQYTKNKNFNVLAGWDDADLRPSLLAFRHSCAVFLKQNPEKNVGSQHISLKAKDWQPACRAAMIVDDHSDSSIRDFFESWFKPVAVSNGKLTDGLFTGYYAPSVKGSRTHSAQYSIPIYSAQQNKSGKVLAWVANNKDRKTLQTEGSAVIDMDDGDKVPVEYVKGASFKETTDHEFHGAQDVTLSPGYSMAIDRQWIPLGTPLWLTTNVKQDLSQKAKPFRRLMIAQDIGSAIRGAVRGDLYWGEGKKATAIGSNVRNKGQYWLLLPKKLLSKLS